MEKRLTDKQQRFVDEYLIDFNATQAAIRSGYSAKTANRIASQNLSKLVIQEAIAEKKARQSENLKIEADRVLEELANIAFYNVLGLFDDDGTLKPLSEIKQDLGAAIHGIDVIEITKADGSESTRTFLKKIRFQSKIKALDALAKYLGLFEKDNEQKGNANLRTRAEFMKDLLQSIDGRNLGLPNHQK